MAGRKTPSTAAQTTKTRAAAASAGPARISRRPKSTTENRGTYRGLLAWNAGMLTYNRAT